MSEKVTQSGETGADAPLQLGLTAAAIVMFWQTVAVEMAQQLSDPALGRLLAMPMAMAFGLVFFSTACGKPIFLIRMVASGGTLD